KQITVRATVIETYDSAIIYVPNSAFVSGNLTNWTSNSRSCRQHVLVSVAYGTDTKKVVKILLDIADKHKDTLAYPKPAVTFLNFGDSNLDLRLTFWVRDYDIGSGVASDIRFAINQRFAEENIEIAYPTMDLHVEKKPVAPTATQVRRNTSLSRQPVVRRKTRRTPRRPLRPLDEPGR
ncbi:MAG: mechanosensitive ion channel, partial [Desulfovibrionaceae bacterium]|nr:mechanosensitive ion channel [Desulfovibrionaceae bacterium]